MVIVVLNGMDCPLIELSESISPRNYYVKSTPCAGQRTETIQGDISRLWLLCLNGEVDLGTFESSLGNPVQRQAQSLMTGVCGN